MSRSLTSNGKFPKKTLLPSLDGIANYYPTTTWRMKYICNKNNA